MRIAFALRVSSLILSLLAASASANADRPHILFMLADDMGWNDVSYHGSEIRTPNIDRLARNGIELDRFYVQPSCSPTRTALMTGKSPVSLGIYRPISKNATHGVPLEESLMPTHFNQLGYQSFLIGKWHLGHRSKTQWPTARGFDHFYGSLTGGIGYWTKVHGGGYDLQRNGKTVREAGYITHLVADEVATLLASRDVNRPSLMVVTFQAPHLPNEAPPETITQYNDIASVTRRTHAAMVDEMDQAIGRILQLYADADMLDNTIVMFASDNGGLIPAPADPAKQSGPQRWVNRLVDWFGRPLPSYPPGLRFLATNSLDGGSNNSPLRGGKMAVTEGGVRVPAVISWPGKLQPRKHTTPMTISDVLPTLLEAANAREHIPADLHGRSQWMALSENGDSETPPYVISSLQGDLALYQWPFKLIEGEQPQLYDVLQDPTEQNNIAAAKPDQVVAMQQALATWPRGDDPGIRGWDMLFDPDSFGGEEDGRPPWPDAALPAQD